ncbi:MAG: CRTAC1 family protein, partial [Ilumatobacteraceae bacterium]
LYINQGDHSFAEVSSTAGVADGAWGWGTLAVDVNHDGLLDLVETNGWDLPAYVGNLSRTWIADGAGGFTEVAADAGPRHNRHGLGIVQFDLEGDGDQDIAITASNDDFTLYRNDLSGPAVSWLRVFLETGDRSDLAPNGVGAMVRVDVGGDRYTRTIGGCSNYNSTSELSAHFGLGDATVADTVTVEWPSGETTVLEDVEVSQTLTIEAP